MTIRWPRLLAVLAMLGLSVALTFGALSIAYGRIASVSRQISATVMRDIGELVAQRVADLRQDAYAQLTSNVAFAQALGIGQRDLLADAASWQMLFWHQLRSGDSHINAIYLADPSGNLVEAYREPQWTVRTIRRQHDTAHETLVYRASDPAAAPLARIERETAYDPRARLWYQASLATDAEVWSPVYVFSEGAVGVTLTRAIRDAQGQPVAVLGVDVVLDRISALLSEQAFGEHDVALIVDERQRIVAHSLRLDFARPIERAEERLLDLTAIAPAQAWVVRAAELSNDDDATQTSIVRFAHAGANYLAFARPLSLMDATHRWRLLVVAAEADVLGDTHRALNENLALVVLSLLLVAAVFFALFCNPRQSRVA